MDYVFKGRYVKSVMVIGVSDDMKKRKIFEDTFVREFKSQAGIQAYSSASLIAPDLKIDKAVIKSKAEEMGIETVLVTRLIGIKQETETIPIPITGSGGQTGIYIPSDRFDAPDMEIKKTRVTLESSLYEVKTEKLIWSATSEIFDPESTEDAVKSLSKDVMKNLRDNKLLR
jgi:hypothetical protein